jgi:microsomal epoxide hydrolase
MAHPFSSATIPVRPFAISHSDSQVADLKTLLRLSPLAPSVFENDDSRQGKYGVSRSWMRSTRDAWLQFDWVSYEKKLNAYPHFVASVPDPAIRQGYKHDIHFVGVYNSDPKATPLILLHGWPGSFIEFLPLIEHLQDASTPVHIIIPSLPGYTYSSDAPMECEFGFEGIARVMDGLMKGLGFGDGYVVQGGDLGGYVSRVLGAKYDACKGEPRLLFAVSWLFSMC